jgi:hypothetical protein
MNLTSREIDTIHKIAERAVALYQRLDMIDESNARFALSGIASELMIVHCDIVPLRLDDLLAADDLNFAHDITGIHTHLDHVSGKKLNGCFLPRYAKQKESQHDGH